MAATFPHNDDVKKRNMWNLHSATKTQSYEKFHGCSAPQLDFMTTHPTYKITQRIGPWHNHYMLSRGTDILTSVEVMQVHPMENLQWSIQCFIGEIG